MLGRKSRWKGEDMSIEEKRVFAVWKSGLGVRRNKRGGAGGFGTFHAVEHLGSLALEE